MNEITQLLALVTRLRTRVWRLAAAWRRPPTTTSRVTAAGTTGPVRSEQAAARDVNIFFVPYLGAFVINLPRREHE